jgi:hypothetical protein
MRFADELRGSEGQRCRVTDLRNGKSYFGTIEKWDDRTKKAQVLYDDGVTRVRVAYSFVSLLDEETP